MRRLACLAMLCACGYAEPAWRLTRNEHFAVYSQAGDEHARSTLTSLEQLRAFFLSQDVVRLGHFPVVRVIVFGSTKEYDSYRLRTPSDAYYLSAGNRNYIVANASSSDLFKILAHEYAHLLLHADGSKLPSWLDEGLAEFFSSVRVSTSGGEVGGDLPARSQQLRHGPWIPLSELVAMQAIGDNRENATLFYSESWALTQMLATSSEYAPRFRELMIALNSGGSSLAALAGVYGRPPEAIMTDLHAWVNERRSAPVQFAGAVAGSDPVEVSELSSFAARSLMAELLAGIGELDRAESLYRELAREAPEAAEISAAMGMIALQREDLKGARQAWKRAIEHGVMDADLCHNYAILADRASVTADEIRPALERAVELRPAFDDARYMLALLEKNAGRYEVALAHFRAMQNVAGPRAYHYWSAVADTLLELDRRDEALAAAARAQAYASTPAERLHASQLTYFAKTDLAVQLTRDANGNARMVTTRKPHGTDDWNPFIEAGDNVQRVEGALRIIDCSGEATRILVESKGRTLTLAILDPKRVQMRNAPLEFVCGAQEKTFVNVEYAVIKTKDSDGVVRGIDFR